MNNQISNLNTSSISVVFAPTVNAFNTKHSYTPPVDKSRVYIAGAR